MRSTTYYVFILLFLFSFISCKQGKLTNALKEAGDNRAELEKVLAHYKNDELKLKAAKFLIENMDVHYTYTGEAVDTFYHYMDSVFEHSGNQNFVYYSRVYDEFFSQWGDRLNQIDDKLYDINSIKADYLITNIDSAFAQWQNNWACHYDFEHFCKYILPYRAGHEPLSSWREEFITKFRSKEQFKDGPSNHSYAYCIANRLLGPPRKMLYIPQYFMPEYPLVNMKKVKSGFCRDFSNLGIAKLRAHGLPVAIDFVPQWGNHSMGHEWNVFLPAEGVVIPFSPGEDLGFHFFRNVDNRLTKVFRKTYEKRRETLYYQSGGETIPGWLDTPCIRDVTSDYTETTDVSVSILKGKARKRNIVYLAVFDNQKWTIVHWAKRQGSKALFKNMARGVVYLPVYYSDRKETIPAGKPFLLTQQGECQPIIADHSQKQDMALKRKYRGELLDFRRRVHRGRFQVASKDDFSDAITIATIDTIPECNFQTIRPEYEGSYRYFRYVAPDWSYGNMAELEMYDETGAKLEPARIFGNRHTKTKCEVEALFDGDVLSYYDTHPGNGAWAAVEFESEAHLERIIYLPRNDDNFIRDGELYELYYWENSQWKSLGQQVGTKESVLHYKDAPTKALFLLSNLTKGREERIFTYEGGKQVWW